MSGDTPDSVQDDRHQQQRIRVVRRWCVGNTIIDLYKPNGEPVSVDTDDEDDPMVDSSDELARKNKSSDEPVFVSLDARSKWIEKAVGNGRDCRWASISNRLPTILTLKKDIDRQLAECKRTSHMWRTPNFETGDKTTLLDVNVKGKNIQVMAIKKRLMIKFSSESIEWLITSLKDDIRNFDNSEKSTLDQHETTPVKQMPLTDNFFSKDDLEMLAAHGITHRPSKRDLKIKIADGGYRVVKVFRDTKKLKKIPKRQLTARVRKEATRAMRIAIAIAENPEYEHDASDESEDEPEDDDNAADESASDSV